jgi:hypothetical protein
MELKTVDCKALDFVFLFSNPVQILCVYQTYKSLDQLACKLLCHMYSYNSTEDVAKMLIMLIFCCCYCCHHYVHKGS